MHQMTMPSAAQLTSKDIMSDPKPELQPWVREQPSKGLRLGAVQVAAVGRPEGVTTTAVEGDAVDVLVQRGNQKQWVAGKVVFVVDEHLAAISEDMPVGAACIGEMIGADGGSLEGSMIVNPGDMSQLRKPPRITVVAPGAGIGSNGEAYIALGKLPDLQVEVVGRKSTLYDKYPDSWSGAGGGPPPNFESFANDIIDVGIPARSDCLIFGSRGGQCCLPKIWRALGERSPPSIVQNGGCAMNVPGGPVAWPQGAVTLMLLGGQDFFKGDASSDDYLNDLCSRVPSGNLTTAMLYMPECEHIPQKKVLGVCLQPLVRAALQWQLDPSRLPIEPLNEALVALERIQFGGRLRFTSPNGWREQRFGPQTPDRPVKPFSPRVPHPPLPAPSNPIGTAPCVVPVEWAVHETPEAHYRFAKKARLAAAEAEEEARKLEGDAAQESDPRSQRYKQFRAFEARCRSDLLLEVAAGQEGEGYAQAGDEAKSEAKERMKAAQAATRAPQPQARLCQNGVLQQQQQQLVPQRAQQQLAQQPRRMIPSPYPLQHMPQTTRGIQQMPCLQQQQPARFHQPPRYT